MSVSSDNQYAQVLAAVVSKTKKIEMKKLTLIAVICYLSIGQLSAQDLQKIDSKHFKNLYQINETMYRSEQPSKKGFRELEALGVKSIITFRRLKDDTQKAKGADLSLVQLPLKAKILTEADIIEGLKLIHKAEKPVLIHCYAGSDRTGVMSAASRVVFQGWSKAKAVEEMRIPALGYHEKWYPNLVHLIMDLDVDKVKKELGID